MGLAAWFCGPRLAYALAMLLPLGRFFIAEFANHTSQVQSAEHFLHFLWGDAVVGANDNQLSDGHDWRDGCVGEGGGATGVTTGAVRCSAWLGDSCVMVNPPPK